MAYSVYHVELGIELNLTLPDLGHPEHPGLWELLRADTRPVPERKLQCMHCRQTRPECPEWMFLTERHGVRFASHYTKGIADHPQNESDEHKAYKERIVQAAELGGFTAEPEDRAADGKRRTDVLVRGDADLAIGWEIQLSYVTLPSVRKRAGRARRDGIVPLWATVDDRREFINKVPYAIMRNLEWEAIRGGADIAIRGGVRTLELWKCDNRRRPCPVRGRGGCGSWHDTWHPAHGVHLDDLVCKSAAGEYVVIILPAKQPLRWWVRADDRARYADAFGELPTEADMQRPRKATERVLTPRPLDDECTYGIDSGFRSLPPPLRDDGEPITTAQTFEQTPPRWQQGGPAYRPAVASEFPEHLVELRRKFVRAEQRVAELARGPIESDEERAAWGKAWKAQQDLAVALQCDPFWGTVDNAYEARLALQQLVKDSE